MIVFFIVVVMFYLLFILILHKNNPELRWDWTDINKKITFGPEFMWGTATAAHQVEGKCHNN